MSEVEALVSRFAARLRELREQAGLSREQLAERAGLKIGGVRDLEQGRRDPTWRTVLQLAAALQVQVTEFLAEPTSEPAPRSRGRPRKASAVAQGEGSAEETSRLPTGKKKAPRQRPGKRKGKD
jgi:transcriptional regulator with XRE-family HTH domain